MPTISGKVLEADSSTFVCAKKFWEEETRRELGSFWRFPSDHLPVGCEFKQDKLRVVSWNVLHYGFSDRNIAGQGMTGSLPFEQYRQLGLLPKCASPEDQGRAKVLADSRSDS